MKDGICPKCKTGILYAKLIDRQWLVSCTNCDLEITLEDRRKTLRNVEFQDRRKNNA